MGQTRVMTSAESLDQPLAHLSRWVAEAEAAGHASPMAMTLATASVDGTPHARVVMVTGFRQRSLTFHSSEPTQKVRDISENPAVVGVFALLGAGRQAIVRGQARFLSEAESDAAFATRPRELQLVAWTYQDLSNPPQNAVPWSESKINFTEHHRDFGAEVPRPASWTTVEVEITEADFWESGGEEGPAHKVRWQYANGQWRSFEVLP